MINNNLKTADVSKKSHPSEMATFALSAMLFAYSQFTGVSRASVRALLLIEYRS
jgi:hypothetical protein